MLGQSDAADLAPALATELGPDLAERVAENFRDYHVLARRDARNIARLQEELGSDPVLLVPQLDDDVHDVDGLLRVHAFLFAAAQERERLIADVVA
jgi:hypothetical protein